MKQHIISPEANQDLEEIIDYFANRNIDAGERFIDEFNKKCRYLANFPNMGRNYADIKDYLRGLSSLLSSILKQVVKFYTNALLQQDYL